MSKGKPRRSKPKQVQPTLTIEERLVLLGANIYFAGQTSQKPSSEISIPQWGMSNGRNGNATERSKEDQLPTV